jgi:hypothetical protein
MAAGDDYERMAHECARLADKVGDPARKALFLEMAQTWLKLAEQVRDSEIGPSSPDSDDT